MINDVKNLKDQIENLIKINNLLKEKLEEYEKNESNNRQPKSLLYVSKKC